jgi:hypothetical protein
MDGEGGFVPSTAGLVTRGLVVRTTGVDLGRPANLRLLRIMRVTVITAIAVTAAAFALLPNARTSTAQPPAGDALQAATRGLALIDSAVAANGGLDRLRAVQDVTIRYRGRRWMAHQSETASPPWNVQPTLTDVVIDIQNNRLMRHNVTRYAQPNGSLYTLWLDAATKRLARLEWLADDPVEGDQLRSYDYFGYRAERGIQVPMRSWSAGTASSFATTRSQSPSTSIRRTRSSRLQRPATSRPGRSRRRSASRFASWRTMCGYCSSCRAAIAPCSWHSVTTSWCSRRANAASCGGLRARSGQAHRAGQAGALRRVLASPR